MDEWKIARIKQLGRSAISLTALVVIVGGLLLWLFRPARGTPAVQFHDAASVAGFLLLIAAGAGVAAMATVQFWKVLFLPRSIFHAAALRSIFGKSVMQVLGVGAPGYSDRPQRDLKYFLDNPTEVVMGQLRSAADYVMLRPNGFEEALFRLAGDAGRHSVKDYLDQSSGESGTNSQTDDAHTDDALVAVRFFVEQHLNLVHINLKERWRRRVRIIAVVVAGSAGLLIVMLSSLGPLAKVSAIFATVVWGGFFSWLARDIVMLVEHRRN